MVTLTLYIILFSSVAPVWDGFVLLASVLQAASSLFSLKKRTALPHSSRLESPAARQSSARNPSLRHRSPRASPRVDARIISYPVQRPSL